MQKLSIATLALLPLSLGPIYCYGLVIGPFRPQRAVPPVRMSSRPQDLATASNDYILNAEEELRQAMLHSHIDKLDNLLDDNLIFTNHLGMIVSKQDDLTAHREGTVDIRTLDLIITQVKLLPSGDSGIVSATAHIAGSFAGEEFEDTLRFTRVWLMVEGSEWKVVAAHASVVASP